MKNFIYLNSNKSGIGDRLMDLILVYTYSKYLNCNNIYLSWTEDNYDIIGNKSYHSSIRQIKTPFRGIDYLLKNLFNYIVFPSDINIIEHSELIKMTKNKENIIFEEYMGIKYSVYTFIDSFKIQNKLDFENNYFENFNKIIFKNIPQNIIDVFNDTNVITIHLRRGDKVCDDRGECNGIKINEIEFLDNLTYKYINNCIDNGHKNICFVSDENTIKNKYIEKYKHICNVISFYGTEISQTYFDLYCLSKSKKILMSQRFSVFSIFSSMINKAELNYILNDGRINDFKYDNIKYITI
jgi:hypothetical protein